jgi:hypothetical protein
VSETEKSPSRRGVRTSTWWVLLGLVAALLLGYLAGSHRTSVTNVVSGTAQVGDHVATITTDGYSYGISQSVAWIDAGGTLHDNGWPTCLTTGSTTLDVTFGWTLVTYPDGSSARQVAYVDCRP